MNRLVGLREVMLPQWRSERCIFMATVPGEEGPGICLCNNPPSQVIRNSWSSESPLVEQLPTFLKRKSC